MSELQLYTEPTPVATSPVMRHPVPTLFASALAAFILGWVNRQIGEFVPLPPAASVLGHGLSLAYLALLLLSLMQMARAAAHLTASTVFLLAVGTACAAPMLVVLAVGSAAVPSWLAVGANNLFGPVGAVLVGAAIGRIVNHPNTLLAAAGFAAFFDLVVVTLGPVAKLMESGSALIQAVSVGAGATSGLPVFGLGKMFRVLSGVTIGPADVLFLATFLGSVVLLSRSETFRLRTEAQTLRWLFGLLMLALVLVEFGVKAVPALAPMGMAVIAANWRAACFTPRELRDLWIGGGFAAACAVAIVLVGPRIASRNRPAPAKGPVYGFILSRIPAGRELVVNGVAPGSPAQNAGIKPGDVVAAVDGTPTPRLSDRDLSRRLKDVSRLVLALRVRRLGAPRPLEIIVDAR